MFGKFKMFSCSAAVLAVAGAASVSLAGGPANDFCSDPTTVQCGTTQASNVDATGSLVTCGLGGLADSKNVWFEFVAPTTGTYDIDTAGSTFDTVLAIFTGCEGQRIACDDDGLQFAGPSLVHVLLSSGQRVLISVASYGTTVGGSISLNIDCPVAECCSPWDNGRFDFRNAQTSQIGFGQDWRGVGRVTADDFWLCEGNIYHINHVSGQLTTDSVVPKADVYIFEDCDGLPGNVVAAAFSVAPTDPIPASLQCLIGSVSVSETGQTTSDGFRVIDVRANWDRLVLKGGAYWVMIYGFSGTGDPDEQFFWGTSGNQHVKGRPGQFAEINAETNEIEWTSIDEICCGCTDFNFCVEGESCKILIDNGLPLLSRDSGSIAGPSVSSQGNTQTKARTADQFVVPPCNDAYLCYIEAWVWTNCDVIRLELYSDTCHLPTESAPFATLTANCVFDTEITRTLGGQAVTLRKAVFFVDNGTDLGGGNRRLRLPAGHNYWLSAYADSTGRQNGRGFFAFNSFCDRECWVNFDPSATKGPPYASGHWIANEQDNAFLVAIEPDIAATAPPASTPTCAADFNHDGVRSIQDLFDYLAAYFAGCP